VMLLALAYETLQFLTSEKKTGTFGGQNLWPSGLDLQLLRGMVPKRNLKARQKWPEKSRFPDSPHPIGKWEHQTIHLRDKG
jgi:hypothetical protein